MATAEPDWSQRFSKWSKEAEALASEAEGNPIALLAVLRELEKLHRSLQDGPLRNSLPADRRRLFALSSKCLILEIRARPNASVIASTYANYRVTDEQGPICCKGLAAWAPRPVATTSLDC